MKYFLLLLTCLLVMASGPSGAQPHKITPKDLKKLAAFMAGDFNSNAQADADKSYYHILLRMKPIWKERTDGYWFYVEQAVESSAHLPYRQRVYQLYQPDDTTIVSRVYEMANPQNYTGGWKDEALLRPLTIDSLVERQGCAIILTKTGRGSYYGSTQGQECLSTLRDAVYATSEVTILRDRMITWDRGWNKDGHQVWGAEQGGYVFIRKGDLR